MSKVKIDELRGMSLNNNSVIRSGIFTNSSRIDYCNFNNGCDFNFNPSGTLAAKTIRFLNAYGGSISSNIGTATIIYGNYEKDLIMRPDGTVVIRYINNSNTQVITAVTT